MGRPATLRIDILADGKRAESTMDRVGRAGSRLGSVLKLGAAAGVAAIAGIGVEAVKSASRVEQGLGAADAIFGRYSSSVIANADAAARAVGLSKGAYLDLANVLGSQLANAGTPLDQVAGKTDRLVKLGADMAATFGGDASQAIEAISSLLKGEADPIERYGVSIKQADINAKMAALGLDGLTGAAAKNAQQQAILALLTEQTATSQGAFARESGTAAGVAQRAGAVWENITATLGSALLPVLVTLGTIFLDRIVPAVSAGAKAFGSALGPALSAAGAFITGRVIPAVSALVSWFQTKLMPGIRAGVVPVVEALRGRLATMQAAFDRNRPAIDKVLNVLRVLAEFIGSKVVPIIGTALGAAINVGSAALSGIVDVIGSVINGVSSAVEWFRKLIDKVRAVADAIRNSGVGQLLSTVGGALFGAAGPTAGGVQALTGAASASSSGGAFAVTVSAPEVRVYLGERELTATVERIVSKRERVIARRVAVGTMR